MLDHRLILGINRPEIEPPLNALMKALQAKGAMNQNQAFQSQQAAQQRAIEREGHMRSILASGGGEKELIAAGFIDQGTKLGTDRRANAKTEADTDASNLASNIKRLEVLGQALGYVRDNPTFENAQYSIGLMAQHKIIAPEKAAEILQKFQANPTPEAIRAFATQGFQTTLSTKDQLFKNETRNTGATTDTVAFNPVSGQANVVNSVRNTISPDSQLGADTTRRGQNMVDARGREANTLRAREIDQGGKPPPGYAWSGPGQLQAIPGGPGDKLPEKQQNQVIGTQNLSNAISEYRAELKNFGALDAANPAARAAMSTKYNNMILQAKEAYNLGVLNGPDLEILQSTITDPRTFRGTMTPKSALDKQASELDRIMQGVGGVAAQRRPQDARTGGGGNVINFSDMK